MAKEMPRHLLGYRAPLGINPETLGEYSAKRFVGVGNYPSECIQSAIRQDDLITVVQTLSLRHLGFELTKPIDEFLDRGLDVAVDYFCGDWWKHDKAERRVMDKKNHRKNCLEWIEPFSEGLFIGLLCERWDDLARICAWVEADTMPGEKGEDFENELVDLYRSLAAGFRPEPMPGLEKVEAGILKSRKKRPKLLFQAWDAARSGNQAAFAAAFLKAVEHFESSFDPFSPDLRSPLHWIAPHHSVVALAARRKGVALAELTPHQQAFLVSRESLGMTPK